MKIYECDKIRLNRIELQKRREGWILVVRYAVGIYTEASEEIPDSFDLIKSYSKSFTLTAGEQTSIKSFLSDKIAEIKTQEGIDEIIY